MSFEDFIANMHSECDFLLRILTEQDIEANSLDEHKSKK